MPDLPSATSERAAERMIAEVAGIILDFQPTRGKRRLIGDPEFAAELAAKIMQFAWEYDVTDFDWERWERRRG